mmetsp:Transcript_2732/g.3760  ORF Transcript_2732/g.3760 Transcript_2732/m.3760 type:complete len:180 (-) Transcript_2732:112-651(-)
MTERGEFISGRYGSRFTFSLLNEQIELQPGRYTLMIDPYWNETSTNDTMYKEVLVDLYGPESVQLEQVSYYVGIQKLTEAMKHAAKTRSQAERKYWLADNHKFGQSVYRVSDVDCLNCWYGFFYTANGSSYSLKEKLTPQLTGMEVVYPPVQQPEGHIEYELPPGQDMIVVLRRTAGSC